MIRGLGQNGALQPGCKARSATGCHLPFRNARVFSQLRLDRQLLEGRPHGGSMKVLNGLAILVVTARLLSADPKLAKDLPSSTSSSLADVIVQFRSAPTKDQLKQLGAYGQMKKIFTSIK